MHNVGPQSSVPWRSNFVPPPQRKRSLSLDGVMHTHRKNYVAVLVEKGQTPSEDHYYSDVPHKKAEGLVQKLENFWKQIKDILQPALDFVCYLVLKTKIHKLCSLSWNVVKIKSIFSFTWQHSSPTSDRSDSQINVRGNYIANQTFIVTGTLQSSSSDIVLQCQGCGHHTVHSLTNGVPHPAQITA